MSGNATAEQINNVTMLSLGPSILITTKPNYEGLKSIGIVEPMWANALSAAPLMFNNLQATIAFFEGLLVVLENQGLDRLAAHVTELIATQKLIEKRALEGFQALTA